jgi:hypothetical protein
VRGPWLLVALALAGCGAPPPPSGSRLHARWQVARGTRRLAGWRDTKLGVDCSFEEYFAGRKHRCVPAMAFAGSHRFADVACTEPLVQWFDCEPPPRYAKALPENSCDGRPVFYEVGEAVDGATAFERTSTGCVPARLPPPLFRQGARVPEEEFVAAEERPGAAGQLELVAEDGAIAPWGGWDGVRAVQPSRTRDGQRRWAPWMVAYASQFADTACTVPAASKDASSARCPLDGALKFEAMTACGEYTVSFWSLGAPVSATYGNDGGACRQADSASRLSWALGAPIPDEQLESAGTVLEGDGVGVKLERATLHGQPIHHTASHQLGGNAPPTPDPFIDTASGRPCEPAVASDGSVRCIVAGVRRAVLPARRVGAAAAQLPARVGRHALRRARDQGLQIAHARLARARRDRPARDLDPLRDRRLRAHLDLLAAGAPPRPGDPALALRGSDARIATSDRSSSSRGTRAPRAAPRRRRAPRRGRRGCRTSRRAASRRARAAP